MTTTGIIAFVLWVTGVAAAWFQICYWLRDTHLKESKVYLIIAAFSLLSWLIYPMYLLNRLCNGING